MAPIRFLPTYLMWHYGVALRDFFGVWGNMFWFIGHFFSVPELLRTLVSPWQRLSERYTGTIFNFGEWGEAFIVNTLMRLVGFVVRVVTLGMALVLHVFVLLAGASVFVIWLALPILLPVLVITGFAVLV